MSSKYQILCFVLLCFDLELFIRQSKAIQRTGEYRQSAESLEFTADLSDQPHAGSFGYAHTIHTHERQSRTLDCVPMIKLFQVRVHIPLGPNERVALTGDQEQLGKWKLDHSLDMKRSRIDHSLFTRKVYICVNFKIHFRYVIYHRDRYGQRRILHWEAQQHPRVLEAYEFTRIHDSLEFGDAHGLHTKPEHGWLRYETFKTDNYEYYIKLRVCKNRQCSPLNVDEQNDLELSEITYNIYEHETYQRILENEESGVPYNNGKAMIIQLIIDISTEYDYEILITSTSNTQELLAKAFLPRIALTDSHGILLMPLYHPVHEYWRIGWLTLPYLIVKPLPTARELNFRSSFQSYWPENWPIMQIRAHDTTPHYLFGNYAALGEQTIRGFLRSQEQKDFNMIKFSVFLTKDNVPVVWPESGFFTVNGEQQPHETHLIYRYIHEINYEELRNSRVFTITEQIITEITFLNTVGISRLDCLFPTLEEVFEYTSKSLGLFIQIEWPGDTMDVVDRNKYLDVIIMQSHRYGCGRPLIFTTGNPDISTMISMKQHIFPVLLNINDSKYKSNSYYNSNSNYNVNSNRNSKFPYNNYYDEEDLRLNNLTSVQQIVRTQNLLGLLITSSDMTQDLYKSDFIADIMKFIYQTNEVNSMDEHYLKKYRVAGILTHTSLPSAYTSSASLKYRDNLFEASELSEIFIRQCVAIGNLTLIEHEPDTRSPFWPRLRNSNEIL